ncbi:SDR family NAD(P)-dependent oxidoreductase [Halorubrum sp. HHNYT27]|uniref:SDR family NAD(P)-dependent oxidoreductase n=1 Tax=Halorubrum sp. HHNYT27 TaxID=3402275 RepID=UPI003EBD791E
MPGTLITGSGRGIGRGIAIRYAEDGFDVAVNYHSNAAAAEATVDDIRSQTDADAVAVQADVGDPDAAAALVEAAAERFGGLSHVVNNAGVNEHCYPENLSTEAFDAVMDTNVNSMFAVSKAARPHLDAADDASIVNLSSRLAFAGADYECHYAASKAGIIGLTKSLALAFAPDIRVNAIAPGYIETDMTDANSTAEEKAARRDTIPVERLGQPSDVADAAAYLRDAEFVTGETMHVNGGQLMR